MENFTTMSEPGRIIAWIQLFIVISIITSDIPKKSNVLLNQLVFALLYVGLLNWLCNNKLCGISNVLVGIYISLLFVTLFILLSMVVSVFTIGVYHDKVITPLLEK